MEQHDILVTLEQINGTLKEIKDEQINIKNMLQKNNTLLMNKINKLQEYNEIDDMNNKIVHQRLCNIEEQLTSINRKLY